MTGEELKAALLSKCKVEHRDIVYSRVSAIIYREKDGKIDVSAELADKSGHSVTIASPREVKEVKE